MAVCCGANADGAIHQPQADPIFQMIGVDDVEPMAVDDVVYGDPSSLGATVDRLERPPSGVEDEPPTGLVGLTPRTTGDLSTPEFPDEIRDGS